MPKKSKGQLLHEALLECLSANKLGEPYSKCSCECTEPEFWVKDTNSTACFAAQKEKNCFKVQGASKEKKAWLVCVDEGLITSKKSGDMKRCDNLLFNDDVFYYVEAKMNAFSAKNWEDEIKDAIENKILKTKAHIDSSLGEGGHTILQKVHIAIPFPSANLAPRSIKSHKAEALLLSARRHLGKSISRMVLSEPIVL